MISFFLYLILNCTVSCMAIVAHLETVQLRITFISIERNWSFRILLQWFNMIISLLTILISDLIFKCYFISYLDNLTVFPKIFNKH